MPTLTITCPELPEARRRSIAVTLTRWFADRGTPPSHVVVRFEDWPARSVMAGGMPVEALPPAGDADGSDDALPYAAVDVRIGPHRDEEYRSALARTIADALRITAASAFFYLEFHTADPARAHILGPRGLYRADRSDDLDQEGITK